MEKAENPEGSADDKKEKKSLILGVGFDHDNNKRITEGENFLLAGGSDKTHGRMLDRVLEFNRILKSRYGKKLEDLTREEYFQIVAEIGDEKMQWQYWNDLYSQYLKNQKKKRF